MDFAYGINFKDIQKKQKLTEEEVAKVWASYVQDKSDKELRDKLIVHYINLIKYVVGRLRANLPNTFSTEDIAGNGVEGLIDAIERFIPSKGVRFETYALTRIRGAILDKIRSQDWVPRTVRKKFKDIQRSIAKLQAQFGRKPTLDEISLDLNIPKEKIQTILNDMEGSNVISLYAQRDSSSEGVTVLDTIEDTNSPDPAMITEEKDVKRELSLALKQLPERERTILTLYYHENMTLKEIGDAVSISESRVCQIHAQAIMKLKSILSTSKKSQKVK